MVSHPNHKLVLYFPFLTYAIEISHSLMFILVAAIKKIKATYGLSKISWQGDPCLPQELSWENLTCTYVDTSTPPRIVSL